MDYPAWMLMWLIGMVLFVAGKVWLWRQMPKGGNTAAFIFLWPGMNIMDWQRKPPRPAKHRDEQAWHYGMECMMAGVILFWGMGSLIRHPWVAGWCGMAGLVLMLHFGVFRLLAVWWMNKGHDVRPIMLNPMTATSLSEFWGRRWNRAFRDLVHPLVFTPMLRKYGAAPALWGCFIVSGLVHELVISLPAGAGYGSPTLYFIIQALGITMEKHLRFTSRFFTYSITLGPVFLLFHPPFLERVMLPFMHALGAQP